MVTGLGLFAFVKGLLDRAASLTNEAAVFIGATVGLVTAAGLVGTALAGMAAVVIGELCFGGLEAGFGG